MYVGLAAPARAQSPSPGSPVAELVLPIPAGNEGAIARPDWAALAFADASVRHGARPR